MEKLLMRVEEAADALGLSRSKVYKLIATKELPCVRVGGSVRVSTQGLKDWLDARSRSAMESPVGCEQEPATTGSAE